jgi:hypothetical protein
LSDKHNKPKARNNTAGFTKAGRNSRSGGKNQQAARKVSTVRTQNGASLFDQLADDRRTAKDFRTKAYQERSQRERAFLVSQATLAKSMISLGAGTLAEKVAYLIIDAFPTVTVNKREGLSRTEVARVAAMLQLESHEISRQGAIDLGFGKARHALYVAFDRLKAEELQESNERQLVDA